MPCSCIMKENCMIIRKFCCLYLGVLKRIRTFADVKENKHISITHKTSKYEEA